MSLAVQDFGGASSLARSQKPGSPTRAGFSRGGVEMLVVSSWISTSYNRLSRDRKSPRDKRRDGLSLMNQRDEQRRGVYPIFRGCGYNRWHPSALINVNLRQK